MNLVQNNPLSQEEQMSLAQGIILRIDRVGSFRLILDNQVVLGGPGALGDEVVRIMAPLSSRHACIRRNRAGYSIEPLRGSVEIKSKPNRKNESQLLLAEAYFANNTKAMLTPDVGVKLEIVSPLTQSARLTVTPAHRLDQGLDGLILMENMILLGPGRNMHIPCDHWEQAGALIFRNGSFRFCLPIGLGNTENNDKTGQTIDEVVLLNRHYCYDEIGFYLEG